LRRASRLFTVLHFANSAGDFSKTIINHPRHAVKMQAVALYFTTWNSPLGLWMWATPISGRAGKPINFGFDYFRMYRPKPVQKFSVDHLFALSYSSAAFSALSLPIGLPAADTMVLYFLKISWQA
jgi:hypothetical protein